MPITHGKAVGGMRKLRVLVLAESANPEWTSVPLVGWNLANALSKVANVHVVTQIRNRDAFLRKGWIEGQDFTAIDNEKVVAPLHRIATRIRGGDNQGWTTVMAVMAFAYYSFEWQVWRRFRQQLIAHDFDLVHRVTPVSPTIQSLIASRLARIGVPFVVGPLNGGVPWPKGFRHRQHAEREFLSNIRRLYQLMPAYRSMRRSSSAIICGSTFTQDEIPDWARQKSVFIPENGVDGELFCLSRSSSTSSVLQGAFVGRLVPYKGADLLIRAAEPFLKDGVLKLHIIGDGPQGEALRQMVNSLGLEQSVLFHGWVPHSKIQERLIACDFLGFPSIREFGGGVVVEAMAVGVTPIVADYGGPADLVNDETGIRVPFGDEESLVRGFRSAIANAIQNPQLLNRLGSAARARVLRTLTWEAKAQQMLRIYHSVMSSDGDLPALGFPR
ncbi:glycosyltransferase family 4 protein [Bradyrhizobium lablabi]|uniref:glycosyltransferase family 4 protein n=1 Tax=Bradyrhizobium lablabi TaxID=722472 RepID=UPI001BACC34B|nr:glycosyltransferase [Bradyrhizobium lablabi]MBR0697777.1 glycosyltransferase [Bradyrhizobium lablabi]